MNVPADVRLLVICRQGWACLLCSGRLDGPQAYSLHHRRPRMMGGTRDPRSSDPRNLVAVCGSGTTGCHGRIESKREWALENGWLLRSLDDIDRPLVIPGRRKITLTSYGGTITEDYPWADDETTTEEER